MRVAVADNGGDAAPGGDAARVASDAPDADDFTLSHGEILIALRGEKIMFILIFFFKHALPIFTI